MKDELNEIERRILNLIQEEFPISSRPYSVIGRSLGMKEKQVMEIVKSLKERGYIRRIGPVLERRNLKLFSYLCATTVEDDKIEEVVKEINRHKGVTHNYERDGKPNLWFTITGETKEELDLFLDSIENSFGIKIHRFPEIRVFKIKTIFPV